MYLLSGPPGAGKTTQAKKLAASYGLDVVSVGALMREKAGPEERKVMAAGGLIDDHFVEAILAAELDLYDDRKKILIDGFPRNFAEARWLIQEYGTDVTAYIILDVPEDVVMSRLAARGRQDDVPEAIRERLNIFHKNTDDVIAFLEEQIIPVVRIDGSQDIDIVQAQLITQLNLE